MNPVACNYSILRFLPYRETGEFVNIGVAVCCPQKGFFEFKIETKKRKRVTDFFPELDKELLITGTKSLLDEFDRLHRLANPIEQQSIFQEKHAGNVAFIFKEMTRIREGVFRFSPPAVVMGTNPQKILTDVFDNAVERQFAKTKDYQEKVMADKFNSYLKDWKLNQLYTKQRLGNDTYGVPIPFVHLGGNGLALKAIKPLDLDKSDSSRIYDHGDEWLMRMTRLQKMDAFPETMIFPVRVPSASGARKKAATEICEELKKMSATVRPFGNTDDLRRLVEVEN